MNKLNSEIIQSFKQIKTEASDKIKKLIKQKNAILICYTDWNAPNENDFKSCGYDAKLYIKSLKNHMSMKPGPHEIDNLLVCPDWYYVATKEEIKDFEKNVYPKLYDKWYAGWKQKAAEKRVPNANDAGKLRTKIAKLQAKLDAIEANNNI